METTHKHRTSYLDSNCIGEVLREIRIEKELTLTDLSKVVSLSLPHLSDIERGNKLPKLDTLRIITDALEVSLSYVLIQAEAKETKPKKVMKFERKELVYSDLTDGEIVELVEALTGKIYDWRDQPEVSRSHVGRGDVFVYFETGSFIEFYDEGLKVNPNVFHYLDFFSFVEKFKSLKELY